MVMYGQRNTRWRDMINHVIFVAFNCTDVSDAPGLQCSRNIFYQFRTLKWFKIWHAEPAKYNVEFAI